jgi:hypothetical protein
MGQTRKDLSQLEVLRAEDVTWDERHRARFPALAFVLKRFTSSMPEVCELLQTIKVKCFFFFLTLPTRI